MVQGDKSGNQRFDTSTFGNQMDSSSKRNGFLALQKHVAAKEATKTSAKVQNSSGIKNNWGPFKDRNDFVNMHFC